MSIPVIDKIYSDGVRVITYRTGHAKWRSDCDYCVRLTVREGRRVDPATGFFPDHQAMAGCRSGGRDHCTCDGCF
ncbi:hypothetical protein [Nocardioides alcanivorans]|uniref:hypothetical protein n=1 Tax=Nocardioides alcanivorans TaxID=2897352 RepID=UPI001F3B0EDB|nr:hypothetical protein [Nocardioides alcanivorans]